MSTVNMIVGFILLLTLTAAGFGSYLAARTNPHSGPVELTRWLTLAMTVSAYWAAVTLILQH